MGRLDIGWFFIKRCWDVWVNCIVGREVNTIINFLNLHTIVLPIVLLSYFLEFDNPNIISFLDLREQTVIKSWSSFQALDLLISQTMLLLRQRIDNDVASFLHDIFIDLIISVIILLFLLDHSCLCKRVNSCVLMQEVIIGVIIIRAWVHF